MTGSTQAADAGVPPGDVRVRAFLPADRRRSRLTPVVSLLLRVAVVALLVRVGRERAEERGRIAEALQLAGGGGGGGSAEYIMLRAPAAPPPPPEVVEAPIVVPTVIPPVEPEPELRQEFAVAIPDSAPPGAGAAGTGGGTGGGDGAGQGPGQGAGVGPGSGGGSGGGVAGGGRRGTPPEPRFLIIPPLDQPRSLRGTTVEVTFHLDARGRVTDLEVSPPIRDRGYARKFDEAMRKYEFKPARDADGRAVAGILPVTVSFSEN